MEWPHKRTSRAGEGRPQRQRRARGRLGGWAPKGNADALDFSLIPKVGGHEMSPKPGAQGFQQPEAWADMHHAGRWRTVPFHLAVGEAYSSLLDVRRHVPLEAEAWNRSRLRKGMALGHRIHSREKNAPSANPDAANKMRACIGESFATTLLDVLDDLLCPLPTEEARS